MAKYVIALDQGTTSSRAILFDAKGNPCATAQYEFTQYFPQTGWVEHDPMEILETQFRAARDAMAKIGATAADIAAIGITNQRETTVLWDRATGKPIHNAIVWQCRRTAERVAELTRDPDFTEYVTETTGLIPDAYFSATKIEWLLDNVPGAREKAEQGEILFGTIDTWLIWNLTGGEAHVTDYSNAARTMLFDIHSLKWDAKLMETLRIPAPILPEVCPSSAVYGTVATGRAGLESLAGVPIAGAIGDQQSALFGQACFEPGQAKNTYGTGCFLVMNTGEKCLRSRNRLLTTIAWGLDGKVEYALEGSVFNAGSVIKWMRDEIKMISTAAEINVLAAQVEDTAGAYLVPAFTGLGSPYWDMYARGTVVGLTRGFNNCHFARMVLESIAYQVADLIHAMEGDIGGKLKKLRVDGGASVSDILMQFQSDILGTEIDRPQNVETTALGAAYMAGLAVGFFESRDEIAENTAIERTFSPQLDETAREVCYGKWLRAVERSRSWEE